MKRYLALLPALFTPSAAFAHCPLCTAGAGAAAAGALWFGVKPAAVGVAIGAFAVALGFWFARLVKRRFFPYQEFGLAALSFVLTVLPLMPLIRGYTSIYLSWGGDYGSIFNRTYLINLFLVGAVLGGILMLAAPWFSAQLTRLRGGRIPYQGVAVSVIVTLLASLLLQFVT